MTACDGRGALFFFFRIGGYGAHGSKCVWPCLLPTTQDNGCVAGGRARPRSRLVQIRKAAQPVALAPRTPASAPPSLWPFARTPGPRRERTLDEILSFSGPVLCGRYKIPSLLKTLRAFLCLSRLPAHLPQRVQFSPKSFASRRTPASIHLLSSWRPLIPNFHNSTRGGNGLPVRLLYALL